MGVWIETPVPDFPNFCLCHTLRGCVDWNIHTTTESKPATPVTPCVGVWIETDGLSVFITYNESHPAWVCGLKQVNDSFKQCRNRSHTLRGCVDWNRKIPHNGKQKHQCHTLRGCVDWNWCPVVGCTFPDVTPCVGVWIETRASISLYRSEPSHPAWVCGLKHTADEAVWPLWGHTLRGCVDWNFIIGFMNVRHFGSHPAWVCGLKQS